MNDEGSKDLPPKTSELISETLLAVRKHPEHYLYSAQRGEIYLSFGDSRLNLPPPLKQQPNTNPNDIKLQISDALRAQWMHAQFADFVIGELSILTTKYVFEALSKNILSNELNRFEKDFLTDVTEIMELARLLLDNEIRIETAKEQLTERYWFFEFTEEAYNISRLYSTAVLSLNIIIYGARKPDRYSLITPENWKAISMDYASEAANAISAIPNPTFRDWQNSDIPISFDKKKRLEFWEWWLTEAIPQAWDLAQTSYQSAR